MTYRHIAELSDLSAQYVSMLAKGQRGNPCAATMRKISMALGKEVGQVFLIGKKRA
jgi:transcriptional regulator with XRE-family HTH domain